MTDVDPPANNSDSPPPATTTDSGILAPSDEYSLTVGPAGPTVLHDHYVVQKMQHFNRERVPERVVHAKGSGAHGFFEVTEDVTPFTKASFLGAVGKRTPVFARLSTVAGEQGYPDTVRDPRGFALKFYTDEGNYDLVGAPMGRVDRSAHASVNARGCRVRRCLSTRRRPEPNRCRLCRALGRAALRLPMPVSASSGALNSP